MIGKEEHALYSYIQALQNHPPSPIGKNLITRHIGLTYTMLPL